TERERSLRHARARGVDRNDSAALDRVRECRLQTRELLGVRNGDGTGPRRFRADVDDVGAVREQSIHLRASWLGLEVATTVVKRVGRDVEHAHERRAVLMAKPVQRGRRNAHWATLANPAEPRKFQALANESSPDTMRPRVELARAPQRD